MQTIKKVLNVWHTITVGNTTVEELINEIERMSFGYGVNTETKGVMRRNVHNTRLGSRSINLVVLTPGADLGFTEHPYTDQFMTKECCAKWSAENLDGYVIELCEPEDGPQLRVQYKEQPIDEILHMAMESIPDSDGNLYNFSLSRDNVGVHNLDACHHIVIPRRWHLKQNFVFRLLRVT